MGKIRFAAVFGLAVAACMSLTGPAGAQAQNGDDAPVPGVTSTEKAPTRAPETGLAVMDCKPAKPAPTESCLLRPYAPYSLDENPKFKTLGSGDADFEFSSDFGEGISKSSTLLLVDLSQGAGNARAKTFEIERAYIKSFIEALPAGERVALYGFDGNLRLLQDFTRNHDAVLEAAGKMAADGLSTRIGYSAMAALDKLNQEDKSLFRNLVVFTDGADEGAASDATSFVSRAIQSNIPVSVAMLSPGGEGATGFGARSSALTRLTEGYDNGERQVIGVVRLVNLKSKKTDRDASFKAFTREVSGTISAARVIVPDGTPGAARFTLRVKEPGVRGAASDVREYKVTFTPKAAAATPAVTTGEGGEVKELKEEDLLFGLPRNWVYIGAAVLGGLLLIILLWLLIRALRGRGDAAPAADTVADLNTGFDEFDNVHTQGSWDEDIGAVPGGGLPPTPPAPAPAEGWLIERDSGKRHPMRASASIGRAPGNDVVLVHTTVSRRHAELRKTSSGWMVTDLGSANGTFVNGAKINGSQAVRPGDELGFGEALLTLA